MHLTDSTRLRPRCSERMIPISGGLKVYVVRTLQIRSTNDNADKEMVQFAVSLAIILTIRIRRDDESVLMTV